jgi:hypothetical protein
MIQFAGSGDPFAQRYEHRFARNRIARQIDVG